MIREDTVRIYQDVAVKDYTKGDERVHAGWTVMAYNGSTNGEGTIYLNTYFMDGYDYDERKSVALHELGHALGLGESSYTYNCMYSGYSRNITLSFADRRSLDEVVRWLMEMDYIPSFCTACYRAGRTGDRFMALCKSGQIQNCCHPNALITLQEFLTDYASPETRALGQEVLKRQLLEIPNENVRAKTETYLREILQGARDFRF